MKAGLFQCDHVKENIRQQFGDYSDMFVNLFPELDWTFYDVCNGDFPRDLNECDVYFATGSHRSVYEDLDWINQMKTTIRQIAETDKYFIGFCFGHQLLGEAMGGKVRKSPKGWCVGVHEFEITQQTDWMKPFQDNLNILMMCRDQVLELPKGAKVLAGNEKCPVGIMQIGERLLGIQGHPEFSKAYDQFLMKLRIDRMGKMIVNQGLRSLEKEVHRESIRSWILNFIHYVLITG